VNAIVLVAGVARRLAPLTATTHKALLRVGARPVLARMLRVRTALTRLQSHPVTLLATRAQLLLEQTADWGDRFAIIEPRLRTIARNAAMLLAASAVLLQDVHATGRATEGMLETFVPRLRGSL